MKNEIGWENLSRFCFYFWKSGPEFVKMPPSQIGAWREFISAGHGYARTKCVARGPAAGPRAGSAQRAQNGARNPRPVWIGAGVGAGSSNYDRYICFRVVFLPPVWLYLDVVESAGLGLAPADIIKLDRQRSFMTMDIQFHSFYLKVLLKAHYIAFQRWIYLWT